MAQLGINWKDGNWLIASWKDPTGWRLTFTDIVAAIGSYIPIFRPRRR